ncbi:MAG TPA: sigma-70 family RNA polymerase sigma factor [Verrucomicrobiae bacterium]
MKRMKPLEEQLLAQLEMFTAFARKRVNDPELAADVVQESLLKAVKSAEQLREDENVTAWFYRILRRTIIDLYRRKAANKRAMESFEAEMKSPPDKEEERTACACVAVLVPTLKPEYGELVRRLDLEGETPEIVAKALGVTPNNLRVRHHRARQQLKEKVEAVCQMCATHGCLDCTCGQER